MGIEKLMKAAQAAGQAMAAADDELEPRAKAQTAEAWRYSGRGKTTEIKPKTDAPRPNATGGVWAFFTGKATTA